MVGQVSSEKFIAGRHVVLERLIANGYPVPILFESPQIPALLEKQFQATAHRDPILTYEMKWGRTFSFVQDRGWVGKFVPKARLNIAPIWRWITQENK